MEALDVEERRAGLQMRWRRGPRVFSRLHTFPGGGTLHLSDLGAKGLMGGAQGRRAWHQKKRMMPASGGTEVRL